MSDYPYRYGLSLATNSYANLTSGVALVKSKRTFVIYRWESAVEFEKIIGDLAESENGIPIVIRKTITIPNTGMWLPILRCSSGHWSKITDEQRFYLKKKVDYKQVMQPMHMFFSDDKEFKAWMTTPLYNKLIIELI